jgi:two-component system, OmpR family, phosphate regulon sensor histidine kinase PhoR
MKKNRIRWVIALMSVALIGIICLQVYWISHDIHLKEQQFEQTVNQAMNAIVDRIETQEAFSIMNKRLVAYADPSHITNILVLDSDLVPPISISDTDIVFPEFAHIPGGPPPLLDDLDNADINIEFHRPGSNQTILRYHHKNFFHTDSTSTHRVRTSEVTRIYNDSAEITIRRSEEKLKAKVEKMNQLMADWAREFVSNEPNIRERLNNCDLDTIISNELRNRGIALGYDYCVMNNDSNKLLMCSCPEKNAKELMKSKFRTQLFPNDLFSKPNFLVISFPNSITYVLSSMWLMLAGSSLFTLIILFVFMYTIQVIIRQKKISDIKSDFINNMTHEFKTPIATISLAADSLKNPKVTGDAEKMDYFTRIIREENKRMNAQVEHVLQMAQIEKGELRLRMEDVNLHEIIQQAVDLIRIQVESREGSLSAGLNSTLPVLKADPLHLSNVIFNLLDNANKYSPGKPSILISTEDLRDGVLIKVKDAGMGMSRETMKKIFEKFYRVPTGNIHDIKGFGLGLSYVKAIVEQHRGWIDVKSEPGKGSTFELFIPHQQ